MSQAEGSDGDTRDLSDVDEVWIGSESVAGDEFVAALDAVIDVQVAIREFKSELDDLQIGLDREDAINLMWGRSSLNKGQIRTAFDVMDAIVEEDPQDVAPRLMADRTSELTIAEAGEVWAELVDLAEKYGSLNAQTEKTQ